MILDVLENCKFRLSSYHRPLKHRIAPKRRLREFVVDQNFKDTVTCMTRWSRQHAPEENKIEYIAGIARGLGMC